MKCARSQQPLAVKLLAFLQIANLQSILSKNRGERQAMAHNYSKKRELDRLRFATWDKRPDSDFAKFGLTRDQVKHAQLGLQGWIVMPGDPDYDTDRKLFNPVFNAFPSMIVYCVVESDVAVALQLGQEGSAPFTVRSGGHCTAGFSAGAGVLIDVSNLNSIAVHPQMPEATVGCGVTFGKFRAALKPYGLHVPGGECDDVCIGGYMQGGGYGFTSVTFGMNCDNVNSIRVMLWDGTIVTASARQNADLWWAMRGGTGGNFGVLLSVSYKLRPLGDVFGWAVIWPLSTNEDMANATYALLLLQSQFMRTAPSANLNIQVSLCYQPGIQGGLPDSPMYPFLMVRGVWVGNEADGMNAIQPLIDAPGATLQWVNETDFDTLNDALLNVPYGMPCFPPGTPMPFEDKASRIVSRDWTEAEWLSLLQYFVTTPNPYSYFYMEFYGGAINAYPLEGSAFIHRDAVFNAVLDVFWWDAAGQAPAQDFLEGWINLMEPLYNGHVYQNYPRLNDPDYAFKYWGDAQEQLWQIKQKYDPNNVFTFAQAVTAPAGATAAKAGESLFKLAVNAISEEIVIDAKVVQRRV
ncbi:MAG: FAD-binding oxidoreductase [Betaproteobacteria bacterium]|nr:MAG: FAD-binding oxidoreductase [Betaproteobacteria bacterium]